jgi:hypothetical protein
VPDLGQQLGVGPQPIPERLDDPDRELGTGPDQLAAVSRLKRSSCESSSATAVADRGRPVKHEISPKISPAWIVRSRRGWPVSGSLIVNSTAPASSTYSSVEYSFSRTITRPDR